MDLVEVLAQLRGGDGALAVRVGAKRTEVAERDARVHVRVAVVDQLHPRLQHHGVGEEVPQQQAHLSGEPTCTSWLRCSERVCGVCVHLALHVSVFVSG